MTRSEFLNKLREALSNDLKEQAVRENTDYYNQYILDEVNGGRSEEEVIDELGDPWAIARTIIGAFDGEQGAGTDYACDAGGQTYGRQDSYVNGSDVPGRSWWKLILIFLGVMGVLIAVAAVIGGIIALAAPVLIPVLVIMFIVRMIRQRQ